MKSLPGQAVEPQPYPVSRARKITRKVEPGAIAPAAVPLGELRPAPWNPRTIKDERFQNLCRSIGADPDFLWRRPVLAEADGTIYAGNMRYRAVQHLGMPTVPAIVEDLPEQLAKERALRDNHQWGDWVEDELAALVGDLQSVGADLELLGFSEKDLATLLEELSGGADPVEAEYPYMEQYGVTVVCHDAAEQEKIYDELKGQGYDCRVVVV